MKYFAILLLFIFSGPIFSQVLNQEETTALYKELYSTSKIDEVEWIEGENCSPGTIAKAIYGKVKDRINFYRKVNGLQEVELDETSHIAAQAGAYWCFKNNKLSHYPEKGTKCFSQAAYTGCNKSCIGFTDFTYFPQMAFINGFIYDYGASNYYVGHRRCILSTTLASFGYGATATTECLLVMNGMNRLEPDNPEFIAYPWHGYVPDDLMCPKWSFSIPRSQNPDLSNAVIQMRNAEGKLIDIEVYDYFEYQDPTLVWLVKGIYSDDDILYARNPLEEKGYLNQKITVSVKNVKINGKTKNYEYFVMPYKVN